jgi:hypothetical protein
MEHDMAAKRTTIKVGTVAFTRGSRVPVVNDNLLVVVAAILGPDSAPNRFLIRRVDGMAFGMVSGRWYTDINARVSADRLVPVDPDAPSATSSTSVGAKEVAALSEPSSE